MNGLKTVIPSNINCEKSDFYESSHKIKKILQSITQNKWGKYRGYATLFGDKEKGFLDMIEANIVPCLEKDSTLLAASILSELKTEIFFKKKAPYYFLKMEKNTLNLTKLKKTQPFSYQKFYRHLSSLSGAGFLFISNSKNTITVNTKGLFTRLILLILLTYHEHSDVAHRHRQKPISDKKNQTTIL